MRIILHLGNPLLRGLETLQIVDGEGDDGGCCALVEGSDDGGEGLEAGLG